jgi:hypothetical protein
VINIKKNTNYGYFNVSLSAQVLKVDIYIPIYTAWRYIGRHHRHLFLVKHLRTQIIDWKQKNIIHNNYTLYYFVYMYTQICNENALIWGFPRRMFRPPLTWNFDDVNNKFQIHFEKRQKRAILKSQIHDPHFPDWHGIFKK